ncbi:hypothetical protein B0O99DRAFT_616574 [Bisporella sp. PMI_857]|nr:hypothetical protein B0O99DRAFT_616574 [Bisporella sp. PMI_857]
MDMDASHGPVALLDLGYDILLLILSFLDASDSTMPAQASSRNPSSHAQFPLLPMHGGPFYDNQKTLPVLRSVSRKLNGLATPIRYRRFMVKMRDLEDEAGRKVREDVSRFAEVIRVHGAADWEAISSNYSTVRAGNVEVLPKLELIDWTLNAPGSSEAYGSPAIPSSILRPDVRVAISILPSFSYPLPPLPALSITSLDLGVRQWSESQGTGNPGLRMTIWKLLLRLGNLRVFKYNVQGGKRRGFGNVGAFPEVEEGERYPAFRELGIPAYQWSHDAEAVKRSWDFRELKKLDIRGVPLYAFLSSVAFEDFKNLKILKISDFSWSTIEEQREEGITLLGEFLEKLNLEELYWTGQHRKDLFENLSGMKNLRVLEIREMIVLEGRQEVDVTLDVEKVDKLRTWCPLLEELVCDMDIPSSTFPAYLRALAAFPRLQKITLHTLLRSWNGNPKARQPNASCAMLENASGGLIQKLFRKIFIYVSNWHEHMDMQDIDMDINASKSLGKAPDRMFIWPRAVAVGGLLKEGES